MVVFEKKVDIQNPRLNLIYYVLLVGLLVGYTIFIIIIGRQYTEAHNIADSMWTRLIQDGMNTHNYAYLKQGFDNMKSSDLCQNPDRYGHWPYVDGREAFTNYSCIDLCPVDEFRADCIPRFDLVTAATESSAVYLTALAYDPIGDFPGQRFFVAYDTSAFPILLAYGSRTASSDWFPATHHHSNEVHSSTEDILTVIKDYKGDEVEVVQPRDFIRLRLDQILLWSGAPDTLETPFDHAMYNFNPQAASDKVIPRIMGFNIKANLDCFSDPPTHKEWMSKGPVCYIGFEAYPGPWVGETYMSAKGATGVLQPKFYHGIRLIFIKGGHYNYPRVTALWSCIIELIVLSQIPKVIVLFLASYCMGHLSTIYYRAINRHFNVMVECKGVAARLMTYSLDFLALSNHKSKITKATVAERINSAVIEEKSALDHFEVMGLINFCFNSMLMTKTAEPMWLRRVVDDFRTGCSCKRRKAEIEIGEIKSFVRHCFKHYGLEPPAEEHIHKLFKCFDVNGRKQLGKEQCVKLVECSFRIFFVVLRNYYGTQRQGAFIDLEDFGIDQKYDIPQAWIVVDGAGNERANGRYFLSNEKRHDKEVWIKYGDNGHRIQWSMHAEAWGIDAIYGATRTSLYRCEEQIDTVPKEGKWKSFQGVHPAPRVLRQDFSSAYQERCEEMSGILDRGEHVDVFSAIFDHHDKNHDRELPWHIGIGRSQFNRCCTSDEIIEFTDLVQLFNVDRKRGWIEACFDTSSLRAVHSAVEENYGKASTMGMKHAISGQGGYLNKPIGHTTEGHLTDQMHSRLYALEEFAIRELEFQPTAGTDADEDMPVADALGSLATYCTDAIAEVAVAVSGTSRGGCCGFMKKRRADQDEERAANLGISKKDSEAARNSVTENVPEALTDRARFAHGGSQSFSVGHASQSVSVGHASSKRHGQTSAETAPGAGVGDLEESAPPPPPAREDDIRGKDASDDLSKIPEELPSSGVFSGLEL